MLPNRNNKDFFFNITKFKGVESILYGLCIVLSHTIYENKQ